MEQEEKELLERAIKAEIELAVSNREKDHINWAGAFTGIVWATLIGYVVTVIFG